MLTISIHYPILSISIAQQCHLRLHTLRKRRESLGRWWRTWSASQSDAGSSSRRTPWAAGQTFVTSCHILLHLVNLASKSSCLLLLLYSQQKDKQVKIVKRAGKTAAILFLHRTWSDWFPDSSRFFLAANCPAHTSWRCSNLLDTGRHKLGCSGDKLMTSNSKPVSWPPVLPTMMSSRKSCSRPWNQEVACSTS